MVFTSDLERIQVSRAILKHKRTFLAQRIWKDVPWEDNPLEKSSFDYLCDIGCDISGLLEDSDTYCETSTGTSTNLSRRSRLIELEQRLTACFDQLNAWWRGWASEKLDSYKETEPNSTTAFCWDEEGPLFSTVLYFDTFWDCYVHVVQNSFRIILLRIWSRLSETETGPTQLSKPLEEANPLPVLGISTDSAALALEILRCLEFCDACAKKFLGSFCVLFPLNIAQECLPGSSREGKWLSSTALRDLSPDGSPLTSCISAAYYNNTLIRSLARDSQFVNVSKLSSEYTSVRDSKLKCQSRQ